MSKATRHPPNNAKSILIKALKQIAEHKQECDEWEGAAFFLKCQEIASQALTDCNIPHNPSFGDCSDDE